MPRNRSKIVPNSNRNRLELHFSQQIGISLTSAPSDIDQERVEIWPFSNDKQHHIPKWPLGKISNFCALWGRSSGTQDRLAFTSLWSSASAILSFKCCCQQNKIFGWYDAVLYWTIARYHLGFQNASWAKSLFQIFLYWCENLRLS